MSELSIGEVARRTGIRPSALRYYEEVGLLPRTPRTGGRRRYGEQAVQMVELLRFAQQAGFTLDEIRKLFHGFDAKARLGERWRLLAEAKLRELDELQARIVGMRRAIEQGLACGCMRIEDCTLAKLSADTRAPTRARRHAGRRVT
jgi:MerR family redox-sensitive transcriptional activator SoxR